MSSKLFSRIDGALLMGCVCAMLLMGVEAGATQREGIEIRPDANGGFVYEDDFQTPRFLKDVFVSGYREDVWRPGEIRNHGPDSWSLVYRFHGRRVIRGVDVRIEQSANGPNLGGYNDVYVSDNGLDWRHAAGSGSIEPAGGKWQNGPLTVSRQAAAAAIGGTEFWLRLDLRNTSGLPTNTSSSISKLHVALKLDSVAVAKDDPQAKRVEQWGNLRAASGWRSIALDATDPPGQRPPHYFEDADGWLRRPGEQPHFSAQKGKEIFVRRAMASGRRLPLSLVTFLQRPAEVQTLMASITVAADRDTSRRMNVLYNGESAGEFDTASYFAKDQTFFVSLPPQPRGAGHSELRIQGEDGRGVRIRRITIAHDGSARARWAAKPALRGGESLEVLSAYYIPDPAPPAASQAVEGRNEEYDVGLTQKHLQRLYKEHADFGAVRVVLRNPGDAPLRIGDRIELNGRPIEDHEVDFVNSAWDARGVVWRRVRPQLVKPGACAQVYVRFRRRPAGANAAMTIHLENGEPVNVTVPYVQAATCIDYVTVDKTMKKLYVYARRTAPGDGAHVTGITLDGVRLDQAKIYGPAYAGNVALAAAQLARPLKAGDYHVVGVEIAGEQTIAAQFRILPWFYPRSSVHVPAALCGEMHMNMGLWHNPLDACNQFNIDTAANNPFDSHTRVRYILGPDEPDAHDNRGGGYDRGLGSIARQLAHGGWQQLIERFAPQAASWIIMNGTTRPLNWSVYGQVADIACFDPYTINFYSADHAYIRESLLLARQCGAPNRMYACMEAFGWGPGQGVPPGARGPTPAEYRQNVVQAIGSGMKGLTSWVHSAGAGGWEINDACRAEIADVNRLIAHIEDDLLLATPIDLASSNAGVVMTGVVSTSGKMKQIWPKQRVWAGALLSGPDTIVIAAANHIPASKLAPPVIEPTRDVTITVDLPPYLRNVTAFEATEYGVAPIKCQLVNAKAKLHLDAIESGRVFLLRRAR